MNDKVFLDSNILVYSYSFTEINKKLVAREIIEDNYSIISTQVLQELCNIITRKFKFSFELAAAAIDESCKNNSLHTNTKTTILQACRVAERYGFSFYDSLIISAALESNCSILYSEDLNDGQVIDETLIVRNPFK